MFHCDGSSPGKMYADDVDEEESACEAATLHNARDDLRVLMLILNAQNHQGVSKCAEEIGLDIG